MGDQFDWTRRSKSTPSSGTGPDFDHTKGTLMIFTFFFSGRGVDGGWEGIVLYFRKRDLEPVSEI